MPASEFIRRCCLLLPGRRPVGSCAHCSGALCSALGAVEVVTQSPAKPPQPWLEAPAETGRDEGITRATVGMPILFDPHSVAKVSTLPSFRVRARTHRWKRTAPSAASTSLASTPCSCDQQMKAKPCSMSASNARTCTCTRTTARVCGAVCWLPSWLRRPHSRRRARCACQPQVLRQQLAALWCMHVYDFDKYQAPVWQYIGVGRSWRAGMYWHTVIGARTASRGGHGRAVGSWEAIGQQVVAECHPAISSRAPCSAIAVQG